MSLEKGKPFSYSDGPSEWAVNAFSSSSWGSSPSRDILSTLAPAKSFTVSTTPLTSLNAGMANAAPQIQQVRQATVGVQQQVQSCKADIAATIRTAQRECAAAAKSCGYQAEDLWKDERMAPGSMLEMAPALLAECKGAGTFVTIAKKVSAASDIEFIASNMKKGVLNPQEAKAEIAQKLSEGPGVQDTRNTLANIFPTDAPPEMDAPSLDWKTCVAQHGPEALDQIMALDPDNPNCEIVPQIADLNKVDHEAGRIQASLDKMEEETLDKGRDNVNESVNSFTDKEWLKGGLAMHDETMPYWRLGNVSIVRGFDATADVKDTIVRNALEFDPRQLLGNEITFKLG